MRQFRNGWRYLRFSDELGKRGPDVVNHGRSPDRPNQSPLNPKRADRLCPHAGDSARQLAAQCAAAAADYIKRMTSGSRPPECWVISDGRAGIENQALGLAEAVGRLMPLHVAPKRIVIKSPWAKLPRAFWGDPFKRLSPDGALLRPPFPALWIACGRLSTPFARAVKELNPNVFTVQIQAPRAPLDAFDLVIPPLHDKLAGENVFPILGSPNRVTQSVLRHDAEILAPAIEKLGAPRIAVLIGGSNRAYSMTQGCADKLAAELAALADRGAALMITTSRRTNPEAVRALRAALGERAYFFWSGGTVNGLKNPYFGMLGLADHIIVTGDSVNMAAEAAATGKPVHVVPLERRNRAAASKFEIFHEELRARGAANVFNGELESWSYAPLNETERAAREIVRRLEARRV